VTGIKVTIERFSNASQPGWVECSFVDAAGLAHAFEEKVPVVTVEPLDARSKYPREGVIGCEIIGTRRAADGRELIMVDTERPWGIESRAGQARFEVLREQVLELDFGVR
jgi:hypothetical protein